MTSRKKVSESALQSTHSAQKIVGLESFKEACKKLQKESRAGGKKISLREIQESEARRLGFPSYHHLSQAAVKAENPETAERGRPLLVPVDKGTRYYGFFQNSVFKDERSNPLKVGYEDEAFEIPEAPVRKLLRYFSEASTAGDRRGVYVDGRTIYVVENTCDGYSTVAHITKKKLSYLLRHGVLEENCYAGYKGRAIHDADMSAAAKLLHSLSDDDKFDPSLEREADVSATALYRSAEKRRQDNNKAVDEQFSSGEAREKMKDNLQEIVAKEGLVSARFKGIDRIKSEGWSINSFGEMTKETGGRASRLELADLQALALMKPGEIFVSATNSSDGRTKVLYCNDALQRAKKRFPRGSVLPFAMPSLIDFVPSKRYRVRYLEILPSDIFEDIQG